MAVNSHIQIPNCILKQFRSPKSKTVYYLDLNELRIRSCSSRLLGAEYGYYSKEIEDYLNKEIESPISKLVEEINEFVKKRKQKIVITDEQENTVKKYMTASMARSQLCLNSFMKASFSAALFDPQANHDSVVRLSTLQNGGISPVIKNHEVHLIVNKSDRSFVVPRNCFYSYERKNRTCYALPVSPICVIALVPEDYPTDYIAEEACYLYVIDNPEIVKEFNCLALSYELRYNHSFVASYQQKELQELKQLLERAYLLKYKKFCDNMEGL